MIQQQPRCSFLRTNSMLPNQSFQRTVKNLGFLASAEFAALGIFLVDSHLAAAVATAPSQGPSPRHWRRIFAHALCPAHP